MDENILVHGTYSFDILKSILQNGFYPSYAIEEFAGRKQRLLMVSFSDLPSTDIDKIQIYGDYLIAIKKEWALQNNIQPVIYTYRGSTFEKNLVQLIDLSVFGYGAIPILKKHNAPQGMVSTNNKDHKLLLELLYLPGFAQAHADKNAEIFGTVFISTNSIFRYVKNYTVNTKEGTPKTAFNDREWRYVPENGLEGDNVLIFEADAGGIKDEAYIKWGSKMKPHGISIPLNLPLESIQCIIVPFSKEVNKIKRILYNIYSKESVDSHLSDKKLVIRVRKNSTSVWNRLYLYFKIFFGSH